MKSWKTTLFGLIGAIGAFLVTVQDPAWLHLVGQVLNGVALVGLGASARDNKVTSQDVGAR